MLKAICRNLVCIALPLGLAVGCAGNRTAIDTAYQPQPAQTVVLEPTSSEPEERIYRSTDPVLESADATVSLAPEGANPENWAIAEEIREQLVSDPTLAPLGSALIASVQGDGTVVLHGNVNTRSEERRVCDNISALPGVRSVSDELRVGRFIKRGPVEIR